MIDPVPDTVYPIVFRLQIPVQGPGFAAGVEFRGGAVVTEEADGFLAHGLKPGGVAGVGDTLIEAYLDLKANTELALYDIAADALDFDVFKRKVAGFFKDTDAWAAHAFDAARKKVAAGQVQSDLPVRPNPALRHSVTLFVETVPANNPKPSELVLAGLPEAA